MSVDPAVAQFFSSTPVVLDGAMATELEKRGVQTAQALWSAVAMRDDPAAITVVHRSYLDAGARVITTNSYQAALPTLLAAGIDEQQAREMVRASARLALQARDEWQADGGGPALVAGSVGPYGAHLADGSEYTGSYHLTDADYQDFHRERIALLVEAGVDLLAVETQPRLDEVLAVLHLLDQEFGSIGAMVSFSLGEPTTLPDGTPLAAAVEAVTCHPRVLAVGVNCVPRAAIVGALQAMSPVATKPLLVAPNSGERYDALTKTWAPGDPGDQLEELVAGWLAGGAGVLGGCCRTTPETIAELDELAAAGEGHRG